MSHLGVVFNVLQRFSFRDVTLDHRGIHHQLGTLDIQMIRTEMCVFAPDLRDSLSVSLIENSLKWHIHLLLSRLDCLLNLYIIKEYGGMRQCQRLKTKISIEHNRTKIK